MDPLLFLRTEDPEEQLLMQAIASGVRKIQEQFQRNLAVGIANELGKMFGGGPS